nr:protein OS 9 [Hymenolepis microstoma]
MFLLNFVIPALLFTSIVGDTDLKLYNIQIRNEPIQLSAGIILKLCPLMANNLAASYPILSRKKINLITSLKFHGWWTYKVCIGQEITQYRDEDGVITLSLSLGLFTKDYDWSIAEKSDPQVIGRYHSQFYDHGSICDVTGKPRSTELRYVCNFMAANPVITWMTEIATCSYYPKRRLNQVVSFAPRYSLMNPTANTIMEELRSQKRLQEELLYQKKLPLLPAKRRAAQEKVLSSHRSYKKRLQRQNLRKAKGLQEEFLTFMNQVEDNFRNAPSENSIIPNFNTESFIHKFESILRFVSSGFEVEDSISMNLLFAHNQTVEIAYVLLKRMRNSFENSVAIGEVPNTSQMLRHCVYLLNKLEDIKSTKGLTRLRQSLENYHRQASYRRFSPTDEFYNFIHSRKANFERRMFDSLNSTIETSRNTLNFLHLQSYMSSLIGADFENKPPVKVKFDGIMQGLESDLHSSKETIRILQEALVSPKMQSVLKVFPAGQTGVVVKASFQNIAHDKMALIISVEDESISNYKENAKNYNVKINVD